MFLESVQYLVYYSLVVREVGRGSDEDVVHVDYYFPVAVRSRKMVSIMVWNVLGEFVSPKNMTQGSKSPKLVLKAPFSWSPSLMRTLLYPHRMSSLVNRVALRSLSISSGIRGSGYWFLTVRELSLR